jgi:carbon monoxide dehydrogenase subunit G
MKPIEHTIFISESIDNVWANATQLTRLADWLPGASAVSGDIMLGDEAGARYSLHTGRITRLDFETIEMQPLQLLRRAFAHSSGLVQGEMAMAFYSADGGTVIALCVDYEVRPALVERVIGGRIQRMVELALHNFKNHVESRHVAHRRAPIRDTVLIAAV